MTLLLVVVLALAGSLAQALSPDSRIVQGEKATFGEHPYICSLQRFYSHICGCVIYNENYILTAAHCVDRMSVSSLRIKAGLHQLNLEDKHVVTRIISSIKMHPNYNRYASGYPNDVAVLKLSKSLVFNKYIRAYPIDDNPDSNWQGHDCSLTGWGLTEGSGSLANTLKTVNMTKISNYECKRLWSSIRGASINDGHICFFKIGKSACQGDSGGPVRCKNIITGLTSWGITTCNGKFPSVYTRLSYFHKWLQEVTKA